MKRHGRYRCCRTHRHGPWPPRGTRRARPCHRDRCRFGQRRRRRTCPPRTCPRRRPWPGSSRSRRYHTCLLRTCLRRRSPPPLAAPGPAARRRTPNRRAAFPPPVRHRAGWRKSFDANRKRTCFFSTVNAAGPQARRWWAPVRTGRRDLLGSSRAPRFGCGHFAWEMYRGCIARHVDLYAGGIETAHGYKAIRNRARACRRSAGHLSLPPAHLGYR